MENGGIVGDQVHQGWGGWGNLDDVGGELMGIVMAGVMGEIA